MAGFRFSLNPQPRDLPHCSAVLHGRGTRYEVSHYRTTLSIKSVVRGAVRYETPPGQYLLTPDTFLILNDGQQYSMEFEGRGRTYTETLCPFFQSGFLEHAGANNLDDIELHSPAVEFCERLYPKTGSMYSLAEALAGVRSQVRTEADGFPGLRPATRMELYRRLYRGRDFLTSCYDQPLSVSDAAHVAALSPFHFQRMFKLAFGLTPMQFLQQTRLDAARRLLAETGDAITTICFAVGFESLGSFSWLFRKRFGVSPRAFREWREIRRIEEVSPVTGA